MYRFTINTADDLQKKKKKNGLGGNGVGNETADIICL